MHAFFISSTFIRSARLKLKKNQAKTKQQLEADFLLFKNDLLTLSTLKIIGDTVKKRTKNKCVYFNEVIPLMAKKVRLKMKSRSYRYDINRPRLR